MENWSRKALDIGILADSILPDEVVFSVMTEEIPNPYGGNPDRKAIIQISDNKEKEVITKVIDWRLSIEPEELFIDKIKAFAFDYLTKRGEKLCK